MSNTPKLKMKNLIFIIMCVITNIPFAVLSVLYILGVESLGVYDGTVAILSVGFWGILFGVWLGFIRMYNTALCEALKNKEEFIASLDLEKIEEFKKENSKQ